MRASNPNMKILVAQIIPMNPANCADLRASARSPSTTRSRAGPRARPPRQSPITVVDQWTGFNTATDTGDGVHPNTAGNQKIAAKWFGPLTQALGGGGPGTAGPIHAVGAGKCLDVPNASQANDTQLVIWDCNGGTNQRWTYTSRRQLTVYGNKCLDAAGRGTTNGTRIIIWDCNGGTNQQWSLNTNGTITGVQSGLCLNVAGGSTANGALVQLWSCNGGSSQQWRLG